MAPHTSIALIISPSKFCVSASLITADVIHTCISDHHGIFMLVEKNQLSKIKPLQTHRIQIITSRELESFRRGISEESWSPVYQSDDSDIAYSTFINTFTSRYRPNFPIKKISKPKKTRKPWITSRLLKMIQHKNTLYAIFVNTRDALLLAEFKAYRNQLTSMLEDAKDSYYMNLFCDEKTQTLEALWHKLIALLHPSSVPAISNIFLSEGKELSGEALADVFNCVSAHTDRVDHITTASYVSKTFTGNENPDSLFFSPTSCKDFSYLNSMKNSKTKHADGIQIVPVKNVLDIITPVVTHIYNIVLSNGVFPKLMQVAGVVPIYKKGDKII